MAHSIRDTQSFLGNIAFPPALPLPGLPASQLLGLESQGGITLAVAIGGSDTPSANRPARIVRGDYSAFPFLTIQAAIDALPLRALEVPPLAVKINVGAGTFAGFSYNARLGAIEVYGTRQTATPATGPASGTATGGGTSTLIDSTATWTTDDLVGRYVNITSGPGAGQILLVAANDATNIYFADPCAPLPGAGSVYTIEDLATVLDSGPASTAILVRRVQSLTVQDIKTTGTIFGLSATDVDFLSAIRVVTIATNTGFSLVSVARMTLSQIGATAPSRGISIISSPNAFASSRGWLARNCGVGIYLQNSSGAAHLGIYIRQCSSYGLYVIGCHNGMTLYNVLIDGATTGIGCVTSTIGLTYAEIRNVTIGCFYFFMGRMYVNTTLTGTGNAGWGLYAVGPGNLVALYQTPTITGAAGEVTVDGLTDFTWAALASPGTYALDAVTGARVTRP